MSLKAFHIFFIIVSTIFSFGFGTWGLNAYFQSGEEGLWLILGTASFAIGGVLIIYGIKVYYKLQNL